MTIKVFSYGSNMCTVRLCERTPTAIPIAVGYVRGRQLRFHKRSGDGSAKADAHATGNDADRIWGVVFEIALVEKPTLDGFEGLGHGYGEVSVRVETETAAIDAWLYAALPHAIDDEILPYRWYRDLVVEGTRDHAIPTHHARLVERQPFIEDPDVERRTRNELLLERARAHRAARRRR